MSDLFGIALLRVAGDVVHARFVATHPDQWDVPGEKNIALQVVVEAYWIMREGYAFLEGQRGGKASGPARAAAHPRRVLLERWLELAHGRKVPISRQEYEDAVAGRRRAPEASSWSLEDGRCFMHYSSDYEGFLREAEDAIVEVGLTAEENNPRVDARGPDPEATLVFRVRDAAIIAHLEEGLMWASAMYDFVDWA